MKTLVWTTMLISGLVIANLLQPRTADKPGFSSESGFSHIQDRVIAYLEMPDPESSNFNVELVRIGKQSPEGRQSVISELEQYVERKRFDNRVLGEPQWTAWVRATDLLTRLKAVESAEFLIRHLECGDGLSDESSHHRPAQHALINLGDPVIPAIKDALLKNRTPFRLSLVLCLVDIGGLEAKKSLQQVLAMETDPEIRDVIYYYLHDIDWTQR